MHWFANPMSLALLACLPILQGIALLAARRRRRTLMRFGASPVIKGLAPAGRGTRLLRGVSLACGLSLLMVAIAGPQWGRDWEQSAAPGRDLVAVLDLSHSMLAQDVLPNRAERAQRALWDLSYAIEQRGGHRVALVAFAARARLVCPLTHDYSHFRASLAELDAAQLPPALQPQGPDATSGTRIGAALQTAVEAHDLRYRGYQDILLLSDGDDPARDEEWRSGVSAARSAQIPVHTIGVGNPDRGSPIPLAGDHTLHHQSQMVLTRLEEEPLRAIADWTGGTYTPARTDQLALGELFCARLESGATHDNPDDALPLYRQRYPWFFGSALLFLGLEMLLGTPRQTAKGKRQTGDRISLFVVPFSVFLLPCLLGAITLGQAEEWIRRGNQAFAGADFAAAAEFYSRAEESAADPGLVAFNQAATFYRLGRYREAELFYRYGREDATGLRLARLLYGLGNCLLQQAQDRDARRLKEAIQLYELCMQQEAGDGALVADARHNLELARLLWLKARARKDRGEQDNPERGSDDEPPNDPNDPGRRDNFGRTGMLDPRGRPESLAGAQADAGTSSAGSEQSPPAGKGNLPTLPDTDELQPLSTDDAAEHLRQVTARLQREREEHLHQSVPAISSNTKDW